MTDRRNILYILSDDQRYDTIGALGNPNIHTPNLDQLVHRGFSFDRNFCTAPICTPARAEILTGCTSFTNHVPWFMSPINQELTLLPQCFQESGYHTIHSGKWHNEGHPSEKGFTVARRVFNQDNLNEVRTKGHTMRFSEDNVEVEGHSSELFVEAAMQEIALTPEDTPWFCYLAFHAPHDPFQSPEPFASMYSPSDIPLPRDFAPEHPFDNGDMGIRDEMLLDWPRKQDAIRQYLADYCGIISHMDHQIGRMLGALRCRGELDNTIIVFTGDQGLSVGSHGLLGKENMYDNSIASPLIYSGPGIPEGGRSEALVHHVDTYPTLCALAGIPCPISARFGFDLQPLMNGKVDKVRDEVFCIFYSCEDPEEDYRHTQRCLRTTDWKLAWYPGIGRYCLYDMKRDPEEQVDLLSHWRQRRRLRVNAGKSTWRGSHWSPPVASPIYQQSELQTVVIDLYERMLKQMEIHGDPLLSVAHPPQPMLKQTSDPPSPIGPAYIGHEASF